MNILGNVGLNIRLQRQTSMLGKWTDSVQPIEKRPRLKTRGKIRSSRRRQGLGHWLVPERAPALNAGRKKSSEQKFSLSSKGCVSDLGESAAFYSAQMSLLDFGDGVKESDQNHAVVKDAETLTVTGSDTTRRRQEKEARTVGGIPSR